MTKQAKYFGDKQLKIIVKYRKNPEKYAMDFYDSVVPALNMIVECTYNRRKSYYFHDMGEMHSILFAKLLKILAGDNIDLTSGAKRVFNYLTLASNNEFMQQSMSAGRLAFKVCPLELNLEHWNNQQVDDSKLFENKKQLIHKIADEFYDENKSLKKKIYEELTDMISKDFKLTTRIRRKWLNKIYDNMHKNRFNNAKSIYFCNLLAALLIRYIL